jgi:2-keto-4-pentenoate hydratase
MAHPLLDALWRLHQHPSNAPEDRLLEADLTLDEGQALQLELLNRWLDAGESVGGWKIGMTSGASRNAMGDGIRPFGFVLASRIKSDHAQLRLPALHNGGVENELCVVIGETLGSGCTAAHARETIAGVAPGFEINQRRLPGDAPAGLRVADDLSNWGIVAGDPVTAPDALADLIVTLYKDGEEIGRVASAGHIDDHFESIATLANRLAQFGHALQPGQRVITGAYARTPFATGKFRGDFGEPIGTINVEITP